MKLELQLYGVTVSAGTSSVTLGLRGGDAAQAGAVRLSNAEFSVLAHAFSSIQEIVSRAASTGAASSTTTSPALAPVSVAAAPAAPTAVAAPIAAASQGPAPKKRGRPPRATVVAAPAAATPAAVPAAAAAPVPGAKKRGRPPKSASANLTPAPAIAAAPVAAGAAAPKKRGRPPKSASAAAAAPATSAAVAVAADAPKKRGRPPKNAAAAAVTAAAAAAVAPRKRGRPAKVPGAAPAAKVKPQAATVAEGGKRGPGRPRTDGTAVGASRLVELVDAWMAAHPGPKSIGELSDAAQTHGWVEAGQASEFLERHMPRAPTLFMRLPDGRYRRRADKAPVEAPKVAKVMRRRGHDEIAIVRVEAPGT
jgi:hypothetical protein